jgi:hypothetical protein
MSIEAMKQALEALEHDNPAGRSATINALRQAIEFQEMVKKGTKAWADTPDGWVEDLRGGAEIEAWYDPTNHVVSTDKNDPRFTPLGQLWRLVPTEKQEPVAWIKEQELAYMSAAEGIGETQWKTNLGLRPEPGDVPLYTAPLKREWEELNVNEVIELIHEHITNLTPELTHELYGLVAEIDMRLQEKNT